jgi:hypothetical protein
LSFKGLLDVIVELPIRAGGLRSVNVASTDDVTVGCIEIERTGHVLEFWQWKKLDSNYGSVRNDTLEVQSAALPATARLTFIVSKMGQWSNPEISR